MEAEKDYKEDKSWTILDSYFRDHMYPFTKHHLDSFKQFVKTHIPDTIAYYNPITMIKFGDEEEEAVKVEVYIGGLKNKKDDQLAIYIDRPTSFDEEGKSILLTPHETRLRNITYATKLYADIDIVYTKDKNHYKTVRFNNVLLGSIPLMLHSDQCILHGQGSKVISALSECPMDPGGYFIVDGKEKVIVSQERLTTNRLFIEPVNDPDIIYKGTIRCTGSKGESALIPKLFQIIVINPKPKLTESKKKSGGGGVGAETGDGGDDNAAAAAAEAALEESAGADVTESSYKNVRGGIFVQVQGFNSIIPLTTLFRAIGFETDKSIVEAICGDVDPTRANVATNAYMNFLRPSIVHGNNIKIKDADGGHIISLKTMADAHLNLKNRTYFKSIQHVKSLLTLDLFPNIEDADGNASGLREKGIYLGYLIKQVIKTVLGIIPPSDRDSYIFKRVDISGYLLSQLFQETYGKFRKNIRNELDKYYKFGHIETTGKLEDLVNKSNLNRIFTPVFITDTFTRSLKGMWGQVTDDPEQGLVQDLARISYIGFLSHLRRVNIPLDRSIKITGPHRLHSNQWGRFCPFETPDGASVGYLKNLALLNQISAGTLASTLYPLLEELKVVIIKNVSIKNAVSGEDVYVFINGSLYGLTHQPYILVKTLRLYRRNGLINPFISVAWNVKENEIQIHTEAGRPCRPLLIIKENTGKVLADAITSNKWFDMIFGSYLSASHRNEDAYYEDRYISNFDSDKTPEDIIKLLEETQGCIEYLDVDEENTMLIALKREDITVYHTHIEINPVTLYSVVTQMVPFSNHNQAPRVVFHAAQSKQAIGIYSTNFNKRFDTMGYIQHYPQKRIITTRGCHYNGVNLMPNGTNCIVAIMTHTGFNQEDSVMINKGAIDRGLYQITAYKTMTAIEKKLGPNDRLIFANPIVMRNTGKEVKGIKHADYSLLDEYGIIKKESYIPRGQEVVIIGMIHVHQQLKTVSKGVLTEKELVETYTDVSLVTDVHHYGKIDNIFIGNQMPGIDNIASDEISRVCKVRFRKIRRPEFGDKNCLTPEHEVLTTSGWKYINEVTLQDEVYTLLEDGSIKTDKPSKLYEVDCINQDIYDLHSQQVDLRVTLDHNMYVKKRDQTEYEIIKAKDIIGKRVSYAKAGKNMNADYQLILPATSSAEERCVNMEYFLELFGFWISDGWARITKRQRKDRKGETTDYFVEIAQVNKEDRARLIEIIKLLEYNPIEHDNCILISNRQLAEFLVPLSVGAPNKYFPEWVWKLSEQQCRYLYNGLRRGDGTVTAKGCDIYYTSSKRLVDDVQRLALHAGWSGNIKFKYDAFSVNIIKTKNNPTVNHGHVRTQNGQSENIVKYTGKVYCIEVPSHVFYVRKNGKPVWTGNCSSHGQKGVIGLIIPHESMPFTKDGITPDIIINPHAIPSRMTIGHLLETVFSKLCCMDGTVGDGTVYLPLDQTAMYDSLEKYGYEKHGNELLYNARTGNQIDTEIFIGPIFYYRLKHMVTDKIHARDKGPKSQMTRQPTSGRSKHGGLRLGEMERDVVLSHGISQFIKEGWMERSDKFEWGVCRYCGIMAKYAPSGGSAGNGDGLQECLKCGRQDLVIIQTPYAFKLLIQELECLGLQVRLSPDEVPDRYGSDSGDSGDGDSSDNDDSLPMPKLIEESGEESGEESAEDADSESGDSSGEDDSGEESETESEAESDKSESESMNIGKDTLQNEITDISGNNTNVELNQKPAQPIILDEFLEDKLDIGDINPELAMMDLKGGNNSISSHETFIPSSQQSHVSQQSQPSQQPSSQETQTQSGGNSGDVKFINIDMSGPRMAEPKNNRDDYDGDGGDGIDGGDRDSDMEFFA